MPEPHTLRVCARRIAVSMTAATPSVAVRASIRYLRMWMSVQVGVPLRLLTFMPPILEPWGVAAPE